jgi:hypothetical protein
MIDTLINTLAYKPHEILLSVGIAVILSVIIYIVLEIIQSYRSSIGTNLEKVYELGSKLGKRKEKIDLRSKFSSKEKEGVPKAVYGALIGAIIACLLVQGSDQMLLGITVGAILGYGAGKFIDKVNIEREKSAKLREIALISEMVELFSYGGRYQINTILAISTNLIVKIRGDVEKCLHRWPYGTDAALYALEEDLKMEEAATLVSVLIHAQNSGMENMRIVLQEESRNLEILRRTLAERRISSKPLYYTAYRALPLISVGGIVVAPIVDQILNTLKAFI